MGLLDFLSPALTAGTQAATAQTQGQIQGSQLLRALQMQQAQLDKEQAETAFTRHRNMAPVLGEPGYAQAEGEVAGAKANAETPAKVNQARLIAPIDVEKHYQEALAVLPIELQKMVAQGKISLGNAIVEAHVHGAIQGGLQANQQQFQREQSTQQQEFETGQQSRRQAGDFANRIGEEQYREGSSPVASVMRKITGKQIQNPNPGQAPSNAPATQPKIPSAAQLQRAQVDPDYAAFLKAQGYQE